MRCHLLGIPHTIVNADYSHCAFTMKTRTLAWMLHDLGYHVIFYGNADSQVQATEYVRLMERDEFDMLTAQWRTNDGTQLIGGWANTNSPVYRQFNFYLRAELMDRLAPGDVICLPFGSAHTAAYEGLPLVESNVVGLIETGIGYPNPCTLTRVYESEAWRHWIMGNEHREGMTYDTPRLEWVVPNAYDPLDWPDASLGTSVERSTVVYLGRLVENKGLDIVPRLARARSDLTFVLCGQGDPGPWMTERNIVYRHPLTGQARASYLSRARVAISPSRYVEPFCGAAVEAMLCGTPVLTSDFGAFTETVIEGVTGYRCRSLDNWLDGLDAVTNLHRLTVRLSALNRFSIHTVKHLYARVFSELAYVLDGHSRQFDGNLAAVLDRQRTGSETSGQSPDSRQLPSMERSTVQPMGN